MMVRYGSMPAWSIGLTPEEIERYRATHEYVVISPPTELIERAREFQREYEALCERYGASIDIVDYDDVGVYIGDRAILERDDDRVVPVPSVSLWRPVSTQEYVLKADPPRGAPLR